MAFPLRVSQKPSSVLLSSTLILALTNTFGLFQSALYGAQRLDWVAVINVFATSLLAIGTVLVLQLGWGLYGLAVNAALVELVTAVLLATAAYRLLQPVRIRPNLFRHSCARELVAYGIRIQITNIGSLVSTQFNKVLAGHFLGLSAVAAYELGLRVALNITVLPLWLLPAALPVASEMQTLQDRARLMELYQRGTRYVWIGATLLAGLLLFAAPPILAVWTASVQPEAALVTRWLAVAFGLNLATAMGTTIARGIGRAGLETRYAIVVVCLQLVLSFALVHRLGLVGLLIANTTAIVVGSLYFIVIFHRTLVQPLVPFARDILLRPLLITLCLVSLGGFLLRRLSLTLFTDRPIGLLLLAIAVGIYSSLYFVILWLAGSIERHDLNDLTRAIKTIGLGAK